MGNIFIDATLEQERAYIEEQRKITFLAACQWPVSWLIPARQHKKAADILYEIAFAAYQRELNRYNAYDSLPATGSIILEGQELSDFQDMRLIDDYLLLAGYALECILKGCLMTMLPELVIDNRKLDKIVSTHNLKQLCHDCAIELSQEELEFLEIITLQIVWGKYSSPLKLEDMPIPEDKTKISPHNNNFNPFHERKAQSLVNGIFQRGLNLLNNLKNS